MSETREKLLKLMLEVYNFCKPSQCKECYEESCYVHLAVNNLLANGVTVQKWIPVTERLPDAYVSVLVQMPGEEPFPTVTAGFISSDGIWFGGLYHREPGEVTHWMPMPDPPEE